MYEAFELLWKVDKSRVAGWWYFHNSPHFGAWVPALLNWIAFRSDILSLGATDYTPIFSYGNDYHAADIPRGKISLATALDKVLLQVPPRMQCEFFVHAVTSFLRPVPVKREGGEQNPPFPEFEWNGHEVERVHWTDEEVEEAEKDGREDDCCGYKTPCDDQDRFTGRGLYFVWELANWDENMMGECCAPSKINMIMMDNDFEGFDQEAAAFLRQWEIANYLVVFFGRVIKKIEGWKRFISASTVRILLGHLGNARGGALYAECPLCHIGTMLMAEHPPTRENGWLRKDIALLKALGDHAPFDQDGNTWALFENCGLRLHGYEAPAVFFRAAVNLAEEFLPPV